MSGTPTSKIHSGEAGAVGIDLDLYDVYFSSDAGGKRILIYTDKQRLNAWILLKPISTFFELSYEEVERAMDHTGIAVSQERLGGLSSLVQQIREAAMAGKLDPNSVEPYQIATGKPAQDGVDGWMEWYITEPDPNRLRFDEDALGRVDFREMNLIVNVNQDDPLVMIHEPTKGEPGYDVFGNAIPARHGEKKKLGKGKGVRFNEGEGIMYAETNGHVELNNGTLTVSPVFIVAGDVDFNCGNINFRGAVVVGKDITEGFTVRATDGIRVEGMVSSANVVCDKDIEVRGGVTSQAGESFIQAKGRLLAKYLLNAKVDTMGDILIETQVVNSQVTTAGKLIMPNGRLVGGKVVALGGIECKEIGAEIGTKTQLIVSIDQFETDETRAIETEIAAKEKLLAKTEQLLGPYIKDRSLLNELPPEKMDQVLGFIRQMDNISNDINRLHDERRAALEPFQEAVSDEIIVHKVINAGVDVRIDNARQVFNDPVNGPVVLKPNYSRGTISIHSL